MSRNGFGRSDDSMAESWLLRSERYNPTSTPPALPPRMNARPIIKKVSRRRARSSEGVQHQHINSRENDCDPDYRTLLDVIARRSHGTRHSGFVAPGIEQIQRSGIGGGLPEISFRSPFEGRSVETE